jgi:hypothetical protein
MILKRLGKRGEGSTWMTEETARIIVAVLVIVLLFLLVSKLGSIFFQNQAYEQAKATMAEIESLATKTSSETRTLLIESPKNWALTVDGNSRLCFCPQEEVVASCSKSTRAVCSDKEKFIIYDSCTNYYLDLFYGGISIPQYCIGVQFPPFYLQLSRDNNGRLVLSSDLNNLIKSDEGFWKINVKGKVSNADINMILTNQNIESLNKYAGYGASGNNQMFKGVQRYYLFDLSNYLTETPDKTVVISTKSPARFILLTDSAHQGQIYYMMSNFDVLYYAGQIDEKGNVWFVKSFTDKYFSWNSQSSFTYYSGAEKIVNFYEPKVNGYLFHGDKMYFGRPIVGILGNNYKTLVRSNLQVSDKSIGKAF